MNDLEDRLRLLMADVTRQAPAAPQRASQLRRRITVRRRRRAAGMAGLAAVAVVAVLGASAGLVSLRHMRGSAPGGGPAASPASVAPTGTAKGDPGAVHANVTGPKNIVLVRLGREWGDATLDRPESIMIMHVSAGHDAGYLTSIPIETYATIPAYNNGSQSYPGGKTTVWSAYTLGAKGLTGAGARSHGVALLTRTLTALTGLTFDAAALTDYDGVQQVANALGGVDLFVDEKTTSVDVGYDGNGRQAAPFRINPDGTVGSPVPGVTPRVYEVGMQHLTAWEVVDYSHQRLLLAGSDGEYGRDRHQQQLVQAIYRTLTSSGTLTDPVKLRSFLDTLAKAATIDGGGISIEDWLYALRGLDATHLVSLAMNGGMFDSAKIGGQNVELLSDTSLRLLRAMHDDTVADFIAQNPGWVTRGG